MQKKPRIENGVLKLVWYSYKIKGGTDVKASKAELKINGKIVADQIPQDSAVGDNFQTGNFAVPVQTEDLTAVVILSNAAGTVASAPYKLGKGGPDDYKKENINTGKWPLKTMVGYIDLYAPDGVTAILNNKDALSKYNVICFGFADGKGNLEPDPKKQPDPVGAMKSIIEKEAAGTINLISIGGEHAREMDLDDASIKIISDNLFKLITENNLNGVDFDIENITDTNALVKLADVLRDKFNKTYFITAAPQLAGNNENPALITAATGTAEWDFTTGVYDAVFVQAYNTGTADQFRYKDPVTGILVNENSPYIVSAAYDRINKTEKVNKNTKLLIGIPANGGAAGVFGNIWNYRANNEQWQEAVNEIHNALVSIFTNKIGIDGKHFGGLMVWAIGNDILPGGWPKPACENTENAPPLYFSNNVANLIIH